MSDAVLVADKLRKVFVNRHAASGEREFVAVDEVSFELGVSEALAIVGESGSGKTTVARMLVGLERPTSGAIEIAGQDGTTPPRKSRERRLRGRQIQMVFQDPYSSLDRRQSAYQAIDEVLKLHFTMSKAERDTRINELAEQVGLDSRQFRARPKALSGGQRQRVTIARALASEPKILVFDESVASLDVSIQAQILNLLAEIRANTDVAFLFISHDLAVVRQITERAIVMRKGSVVERGTTAEILDSPQHPYTKLLRASVPTHGWKPSRRAAQELES